MEVIKRLRIIFISILQLDKSSHENNYVLKILISRIYYLHLTAYILLKVTLLNVYWTDPVSGWILKIQRICVAFMSHISDREVIQPEISDFLRR